MNSIIRMSSRISTDWKETKRVQKELLRKRLKQEHTVKGNHVAFFPLRLLRLDLLFADTIFQVRDKLVDNRDRQPLYDQQFCIIPPS